MGKGGCLEGVRLSQSAGRFRQVGLREWARRRGRRCARDRGVDGVGRVQGLQLPRVLQYDAEASIYFRRPRYLEAWGFGGYRLRGTHHWQGSIQGWKVDAVAKLDGNGVACEVSAVGRNLWMHASSSSDKRSGRMEKIACGRAALMHLYSASSTCMGLVEQVLVSALAVVCFCFFCSGSLRRRASTRQKAGRKSPHEGELCYLAK